MKKKRNPLGRRKFLERSAVLATAPLALSWQDAATPSGSAAGKKRLAMVGTGSRGTGMWGRSLVEDYGDQVEFVALCDANQKRAAYAKKYLNIDVPLYQASDFVKMILETKPDSVIVTTTDCFHAKYVKLALEHGCDVICEKPLVTNAQQGQEILDAEKRSGKKITTTFNARFGTSSEEIKKVLSSGVLGRIISAEFQEYLDISHGASYFRRWHGKKQYSGSLLVHKASHHFDQMNWWLDADPEMVNAFGQVAFYGKNNAFRSTHCRSCAFSSDCQFYWDITKEQRQMDLYVACEKEDGYVRDGCVWDNDIDTYDSMTTEIKYKNGVLLNYSLNAFMPYEGQQIAFNGELGRFDIRIYHRQPWEVDYTAEYRLTENFKETKTWTTTSGAGEHGGSDKKLKDLIFLKDRPDPMQQLADSRAGVMSSLIGIAAYTSIETGKPVAIDDLIEFPLVWDW
ncbi:MAG: Gfo/Idh/MocA family oxidoreductase [Saprospiraceae bacterium]|nr:Gfo/Idh/MocA family oxidoreductase [Saprospiraceae bacterium]